MPRDIGQSGFVDTSREARRTKLSTRLRIYTFGRFQVAGETHESVDAISKQSKMWSVLKYLIAFHGKTVPVERLYDIIWPEGNISNTDRMLRQIVYRLRKTLAVYGEGKPFVLYHSGNYSWNQHTECWIDVLEFNRLLGLARDASKPWEERAALYNETIDLYEGPFLGDSSTEIWTLPFSDYYRRLFLQAVNELADIYDSKAMLDEIVLLYDKAIASEPHEEPLYIRQIQTLIINGEYAHAKQQYRYFEKIMMQDLGIKPSQNLERLYYEIDKATINEPGNFEEITQLLEEGNKKQGAFFCGPETFRQIYILDKRSEERIQFPVFLSLITVTLSPDTEKSSMERELKDAMRILRQVLLSSLRNGDVIAQYSKSQFILMITALDEKGGQAALYRMKYLFESRFGKDRGAMDYQLSPIGKEKW